MWCPHDSSHDFPIQDGFPAKDDPCTVTDGDSTRTRFVDFCDGGDQNDAIRSFDSLFFSFFSTSRRIWDLRGATAAARRAGHHGSIGFLNGGLLRRFRPVLRFWWVSSFLSASDHFSPRAT